jgi:glutamate formiminotransferase/formiminotetrahydrofolate cyclodeaminase
VDPSPRFRDLSVAAFVDRLASAEPVPGGGSAAAIAGSLAAALVSMVASLSEGRPKYAEHAALHESAVRAGRALADRFLALADDDAAAYAGYGAALKLPKDTDAQRDARAAAIRAAALTASQAPFRTVEACREVVVLAEALAGRSNRSAASDLEVSGLLSVAAARAAAANVDVNLPSIGDEAVAADLGARTAALVMQVVELAEATRTVVHSGEPRPPLESLPA